MKPFIRVEKTKQDNDLSATASSCRRGNKGKLYYSRIGNILKHQSNHLKAKENFFVEKNGIFF